jgi:hypothetical protein
MTHSIRTQLIAALFLLFTVPPLLADSGTDRSALIGTWQFVSVDGTPVKQPFFMRLYADGSAATWPAPADWPTTVKGVSRGKYTLRGNMFMIETGQGADNPAVRLQLKGDEMNLFNEDGDHLIYRRVTPALEPGKYPVH